MLVHNNNNNNMYIMDIYLNIILIMQYVVNALLVQDIRTTKTLQYFFFSEKKLFPEKILKNLLDIFSIQNIVYQIDAYSL